MSEESTEQVSEKAAPAAATTAPAPAPAPDAPTSGEGASSKGGQGIRKAMVVILYALLALSVALSLMNMGGVLHAGLGRIAPLAFALFFSIFVVYRVVLVRRKRYSMPKAVFQMGMGAIFLLILVNLPQQQKALRPAVDMMDHADPSVRALACDALAALKPEEAAAARDALKALLDDPNAQVREHAQRALDRMAPGPDAAIDSGDAH